MVVVNRNFPKGQVNHPNVRVRSPGLPQVEMAKEERSKFRALLATASLFGLGVCRELEVTSIDAPHGPYDTVTIEDGARRLVQGAKQAPLPRLGDQEWSDDARITYASGERAAP